MMNTTHQLAARAWHPEDIKAEVRKRGSSLAELSRKEGLTDDAGRLTLRRPWRRMEAAIANFLGVAPSELWPDRYPAPPPQQRLRRRGAK